MTPLGPGTHFGPRCKCGNPTSDYGKECFNCIGQGMAERAIDRAFEDAERIVDTMTDETTLLQPTHELCQGIRRANGGWIVNTQTNSRRETEVVLPDIEALVAFIRKEAERLEGYR